MIWPWVLNHAAANNWSTWLLTVTASQLWHYLWLVTTNVSLWLIYRSELPFFERYKIADQPWPWQEDREKWNSFLRETVKLVAFNNLVTLPMSLIAMGLTNNFYIPYSIALEDIPDCSRFFFTFIFLMLAEDLILYFVHRAFHSTWLYPHIHKIHHRYINTVAIST